MGYTPVTYMLTVENPDDESAPRYFKQSAVVPENENGEVDLEGITFEATPEEFRRMLRIAGKLRVRAKT